MNSPVTQIKERLSIEDVVSSYIKLEKAGSNLKARCPFHNEKTPSFFVSPDRGSYYCFGCGAKGDIFTFVEEFEGLDFKGALKLLADKAGIVLEKFNKEEESEKERLYRIMDESSKFFENNLSSNKEVLAYLKARGLNDVSIADFKIGFVKEDWRELYSHLIKKGFKDADIEKAGLIKKTEKGFYDRFRGRIMFPISDSSGRIIAFSGRLFRDDGKSAKYLNSPDTPIFSKSAVLYGLDKAKESIRKNNFSILVEGQFDLVLSHQAGFKNTIATSGTALTDSTVSKENVVSNLGLVRRISSNIVLAFDADKAGFNASSRASKIALSLGMDVKVVSLPDGVDPADLISKTGPQAWHEAIRNSKHIIEFLLNKILSKTQKDSRYIGRDVKEKILPYVNALDSSIEKSHFIKLISDMSQIPENALRDDLRKVETELKFEQNEIKGAEEHENKVFKKDYIERRLFGILLWQKTLPKQSLNVEEITKELSNILGVKPEEVFIDVENNKEDLIFEAEIFYGKEGNLNKDVLELLENLKEENLKEELSKKMKELHLADMNKEKDKSTQILKEVNEINNKIQNIKNGRVKN
ncbi:MAG TPA: DNA primase [Candidatus Paceibacterota bacterium]|nr:DNA primase [Candidatus Paceibacterota bacterium]HPT17940.1 DNA primase [Candidatus Paceibacterota bacterium]